MMEPFYIRQTAEPMNSAARLKWLEECAAEAKSEGAEAIRFSAHPTDESLALVEAWIGNYREVGDQGDPRWQISAI